MSIAIDPTTVRARPARSRARAYARPLALALLLAAEVVLFTVHFDVPLAFHEGPWWARLVAASNKLGRLLLVAPAAIAVFGGPRLAARLARAFEVDARVGSFRGWWLIAHGASAVGFARLSTALFDPAVASGGGADALALGWASTGLVAAGSWMAALLPPASWAKLGRREARALALGGAASVVAFGVALGSNALWGPLAGSTLAAARACLGLASGRVVCDPAGRSLQVDGFGVRIAPECSGFEGIGLISAFLAAYLWLSRRSLRWPHASLILPIGVAASWALNVARIVALVLIGAWGSPAVAAGGFHSQAGWLAFLGVALGLVAASRRSSFFARDLPTGSGTAAGNPTLAYLGPMMAILATSMATGALAPSGFDAAYGLRALAGGLALWHFRREFSGLVRDRSWAGVAIGAAAFALWAALEPPSTSASRSLASTVWALPGWQAWGWVALRVIGSVAIVPLAEELAFRGYLARRLISADFRAVPPGRISWPSLLISSAAFGLLHGRWLAGMLVGAMYALGVRRRGRLGDAVVAHATTNLLIAATVLTTGDWSMWS